MANITPGPGEQPALWCEECNRFFNPKTPHGCRDREIKDNRVLLEKWLGTYSIEEG